MRVVVIEPMYASIDHDLTIRAGAEFHSGSPVVLREPIAAEYLAGYLKSKRIDIEVIQHIDESDSVLINLLMKQSPNVLGVSIHSTHLFPRILRVLYQLKSSLPDTIVVCGGNHATCAPDIVRENCIDFVVRGEGEEVFFQLILALSEGKSPFDISGVSYLRNGKIIHNPPAPRFNFSNAPWPIRDRDILNRVKCAPLAYPPPHEQNCAAQVAYSRGCPHKCEFCVSPLVFPGKIIFREPSDVVAEIKHLQNEYGTNFIFFNDLTFNASPSHAAALCDELIRTDTQIHWFCYGSMNFQSELLDKMARAGCTRIGTGAESFVSTFLSKYKKQQTLEDIQHALDKINNQGILNRVYIMLGYPNETKEHLQETLEILCSLPIDHPRLAFITPFPGTPFYESVKDQLITTDLQYFTGDSPILHNPNISSEEYIELRNNMMQSFYESEQYHSHVNSKCLAHPRLKISFQYYFRFLAENGIAKKLPLLD